MTTKTLLANLPILLLAVSACSPQPPPLPPDFSQDTFHLDPGETLLFEHSFALNPTGWDLGQTQIVERELGAAPDQHWTEAVLPIAAALDLATNAYGFYWSCRTDPEVGQDASAIHVKLRVSDDPARREQISLNALLPATNQWYMFYVDPGFQAEHPHEAHPAAPEGFFATPDDIRQFRIVTQPLANGQIAASFHYWDRETNSWTTFTERRSDQPTPTFAIDIAEDLEGHHHIKAINFMFPHPAAKVQATALTQRPTSPPTIR